MNPDELPLLELFNRLREHGLPLGIEEYKALLRALRAGFGVGSRQMLEQLCRTMWTKSDEEARLFHRLFEQMLAQPVAAPREPLPIESVEPLTARPPESMPYAPPPEVPHLALAPSTTPMLPPLGLEIDEPAQVVQAIRRHAHDDLDLVRPRPSLVTEYFPVTRRQMKQSWRHLRRPVREGPAVELDVAATVEKVGRDGVLLAPVLVPRRSNRAELVLLIDQDGSMVPFHGLSRQLVETALRGGRLRRAGVHYFHDYPDHYLYRDPARLKAEPLANALEEMGKQAAVLIISDAGAARGHLDLERTERTKEFLQQLRQQVRHYAWLNPMPHFRWSGTTAGEIARLVPMFEMSRRGLDATIAALRGRYVYWEKVCPWVM